MHRWLLGAAVVACSSNSLDPDYATSGEVAGDGGAGGRPPAETGNETSADAAAEPTLVLRPSPMYSAYDGEHAYQVPVILPGTTPRAVEWSAEPPIVDIDPYDHPDGDAVLLTTRAAGVTTIRASMGGLFGEVQLIIAEGDTVLWSLGQASHNDPADESPCEDCHWDSPYGQKESFDLDYPHTPLQTAGYSDPQLVDTFTRGQRPAGQPWRSDIPPDIWSALHRWEMPSQEAEAIALYLRSLEPRLEGQPSP